MSATDQEIFDAYQAVHSKQASATLRDCCHCLSFVLDSDAALTFVGSFAIDGVADMPTKQIYADPRYQTLSETYGSRSSDPQLNIAAQETQTFFKLRRIDILSDLRWRLQIVDPGGRAYARRCHTTDPLIYAIRAEPLTALPVPSWRKFVVGARELKILPEPWAHFLAETRGVYLIVDEIDGARYVGSAYGVENLLSRWRTHIRGEFGVTRELQKRNPASFRFSILERVSPDMEVAEITALEQTWMTRLHTRGFGLNH